MFVLFGSFGACVCVFEFMWLVFGCCSCAFGGLFVCGFLSSFDFLSSGTFADMHGFEFVLLSC